jgi:hypothetical protein
MKFVTIPKRKYRQLKRDSQAIRECKKIIAEKIGKDFTRVIPMQDLLAGLFAEVDRLNQPMDVSKSVDPLWKPEKNLDSPTYTSYGRKIPMVEDIKRHEEARKKATPIPSTNTTELGQIIPEVDMTDCDKKEFNPPNRLSESEKF